MRDVFLKSYAKVNLFLKVGKKIKNKKLHNIQSLIFLINLHDVIKIKKINKNNDKISFYGKFNTHIKIKNNSISKSLTLLRRDGFIKKSDKFSILTKKNIPVFSGLGGGSSNAATVVKFFTKDKKFNKKKIDLFSKKLGSDFKIFFYSKQIFQKNITTIQKLKKNHKFYFVIVYPFIKSSTKNIYNKFKDHKKINSKTKYNSIAKSKLIKYINIEENSLEQVVIYNYPVIKKILNELSLLKGCQLERVTGSGSACFGLFSSLKNARFALKNIKKKFPKFWCVLAKTI